jgi:hypothetical protein
MIGIEWVTTPTEAWVPGFERWKNQLIRAIEEAMKAREDEITEWMKANHIWKNRTGLAEQGLNTRVFRDGLFVHIVMYYAENTFYSKFLELYMHSGRPDRFSLLGPALDYWSGILWDDIQEILK